MADAPRVRFRGFTDAWERRKLGALAEFNPKAELPSEFEYVDLESVVGTEMISHRTENRQTAPSRAQRLAKWGDLFYQTVRPYQKNNFLFEIAEKCYVFSTGYAQMRPCVDGYFLMSLVQNGRFVKGVLDNCTGTSYPAINANDLALIEVFCSTDTVEQQKIGTIFRHLDHLITLHRHKCDETKELKKYMLQKMFPQNGKKIPEIRFAGFTDAWEQCKLGEITDILSASRVHKEEWKTEGVPFFRSSDVMAAFKGTCNDKAFISQELFEKLSAMSGKPQQGDIFITGGGSIGIPYIVPNNEPLYSKDADLIWVRKGEKHDPFYLYSYFISPAFREYLLSISHIGTIAHYTIEQVKKTPVFFPHLDEQWKIGQYFKELDHLIALHQRKLEELKSIKKFMLGRMFV